MQRRLFPYLLLTPYLAAFSVLLAYPILRGVYMSLFDWGIFGPKDFLGLGNYIELLNDPRFWSALQNTLFFAVLYVPLVVVLSLVLAVLLHKSLPGMGLFRTSVFLPLVINVAVAAIAVDWIIDPQIGMLNRLLDLAHLPTQAWLQKPGWAMLAVSFVTIWTSAGFNVIIYLAGLENIPDELYEAANLDGSNAFQNLVYITAPLLRPITLLITVLSITLALQVFGEVYLLTDGGPFGSTRVLTFLLYEAGFTNFEFGRAAALGVIMTFLIALLALVQFKFLGER